MDVVLEVLLFAARDFAIDVDDGVGEHRCEAYVQASLADGEAYLVGVEIYLAVLLLLVEVDAVDFCGSECACDEQLRVAGPLYDVEVLAAQLADDAVYAAAAHADAGSYGIHAVVEALNGNLGALAGHACDLSNGDDAFGNLGHLGLEQSLQEHGACAREDDLGVAGAIVHACYYGACGLSLAEEVAGDLLALGQQQLVAFLVEQQHFLVPHLIDLGRDYVADHVLVLVVEGVVLELEDA